MRYWWVNQNQTYNHEVRGGYVWSPKRKSNGARNPFYEFMREGINKTPIIKSLKYENIASSYYENQIMSYLMH